MVIYIPAYPTSYPITSYVPITLQQINLGWKISFYKKNVENCHFQGQAVNWMVTFHSLKHTKS